ncbi:hypothetical protein OTK49_03555 [Vibrio coralliirubri]|uniref:phage tail protein n=1 Tax=Vibrio coralliirubri TaxID=1516159 RepID=UPI002283B4D9|nr:hypothetical protein [Vibrio coralliirubri]MCY9861594.1 hypothetical protein [Vibrio coralliirubri]
MNCKVFEIGVMLFAAAAPNAYAYFYDLDGKDLSNGTMAGADGFNVKAEEVKAKPLEMKASIPSGAIIPFMTQSCPDGSKEYTALAGRTVVGAGSLNDGTLSHTYKVGEKGGVQRHRLTIGELPSHTHGIKNEPDGSGGSGSVATGPHRPIRTWQTDSAGGNQYHENRMPYLVVKWCKFD